MLPYILKLHKPEEEEEVTGDSVDGESTKEKLGYGRRKHGEEAIR